MKKFILFILISSLYPFEKNKLYLSSSLFFDTPLLYKGFPDLIEFHTFEDYQLQIKDKVLNGEKEIQTFYFYKNIGDSFLLLSFISSLYYFSKENKNTYEAQLGLGISLTSISISILMNIFKNSTLNNLIKEYNLNLNIK